MRESSKTTEVTQSPDALTSENAYSNYAVGGVSLAPYLGERYALVQRLFAVQQETGAVEPDLLSALPREEKFELLRRLAAVEAAAGTQGKS